MTKVASSLNPDNIVGGKPNASDENVRVMLVRVTKSRFGKREYADNTVAAKAAIVWEVETTKGNTMERQWSVGVTWDDSLVSPDGKQFYGTISKNSDAYYFLEKMRATDFPADQLGNDASVFEGHVFLVKEDTNPRAKGSSKKYYPEYYRGSDWEGAKKAQVEKRAAREAKEAAQAYQSTTAQQVSSYTPPQTPQTDSGVLSDAGKALGAILAANNGSVERQQILSKLADYVNTNKITWTQDYSQKVRIALFDMTQLKAVVATNPNIRLNGETISAA